MTFVLGLTGSIGMGKSTTSAMFSEFGVPVYDADATVHALYRGEAASLIGKRFPGTVIEGVVDRKRLGAQVLGDAAALKDLEAIVHPLVRNAERVFITDHVRKGTKLVVLDIPLLFETHGEQRVDAICVVSAPADMQRQRVMDRQTMTEAQFEAVLAKQLPDAEKRARADCVIDTGQGLAYAKEQVKTVIERYQSRRGRIAHLLEKDLSDHA